MVVRFAENGIELELGVWIDDPENGQGDLRSALNREILAAFRKHGIRIPFPQREVRLLERDRAGSRGARQRSAAGAAPGDSRTRRHNRLIDIAKMPL